VENQRERDAYNVRFQGLDYPAFVVNALLYDAVIVLNDS